MILSTLARTALAIVGALLRRRWASTRQPSNVYVVNLVTECLDYRLQVGKHVAWRLDGRPGPAPVVDPPYYGEAVAHVIALHSPAPIAKVADRLVKQTRLLGKEFVRQDPADPWVPNPREWDAALAEWLRRADDYLREAAIADAMDRVSG